ncbi:MAG: hypothetical protein DSY42_09160 [Aquifex sp.]|nr:MAG: hypothetical protein DSY42_09160 [Aquifex sp.]
MAAECDSLRERQLEEHNIKLQYWKVQLKMQEEERAFQQKLRPLQLKEAEARTIFFETLQHRIEESCDALDKFL